MKKLLLSLAVLCFILVSCGSNQPAPTDATDKGCCQKEEKCCKGMTEEQKQECAEFKAKWEDWANQTDEVKQELIGKRKECFDKKMEEMKAMEAKMQEHKATMEEKLATWETMTLDEQKAFFDEFGNCCMKIKAKDGCGKDKESCPKAKDGCPKAKDGCCAKKEGEGCPKQKEGCEHKE